MTVFQDLPYVRPDVEAVRQCYADAVCRLACASSYGEAREAFFAVQQKEEDLGTMSSLCMVRNTIDTADACYEGERKWLREQNAALIPLRKQFREALAGCRFRFDTASLTRADVKTTAERNQMAIRGGWRKPNEVRAELGLPPDPVGDLLMSSRDLIPLRIAAEQPELLLGSAGSAGTQESGQDGSQAGGPGENIPGGDGKGGNPER